MIKVTNIRLPLDYTREYCERKVLEFLKIDSAKEIILDRRETVKKENEDVTVNDIRRWHIEKGYNDIGYHYVIYIDGSVHVGRDIKIEGAHCLGYNANSIGVCYVGGLDSFGNPKNTMNEKQVDSLIKLCKGFKNKYPIIKILGHNELSNRDCPCFDVKQFLKQNKL